MAFDVTTEWGDIHRKLGNYPALPPKVSQEELSRKAIDIAEGFDPLKYKTAEQIEALEDDVDPGFLEEYKQKRMQELRAEAQKPRFGQVYEISKQDYVAEVNEAGAGIYVLVHMYQDYISACTALNLAFEQLCLKFRNHKFIKIVATRCVENFRDSDCPALLIYRDGAPVHQYLSCAGLFGPRISADAVEWKLSEEGIWQTDLEDKPSARSKITRQGRQREDYDSDEDDDREYVSNHMPKRY